VPVPVPKDSDCDQVSAILRETAESNSDVLEDPPPRVLFKKIGDAILEFELVCFVPEVETAARVSSDLTFVIFRRLRSESIIKSPPAVGKIEIVNATAFTGGLTQESKA